ncbi:hypothetical protein FACS1894102_6660 [Spirochaetia bacterium]|nr:hypothetical protein FACS1894102_6660 [Spirochaetia bacterium]
MIDLSLWGDLSLHTQKIELVKTVLKHPELSLVIETSGIGWRDGELEEIASAKRIAQPRLNGMSAISVIISLDGIDEASYKKLRGEGFAEAFECVKKVAALFGNNAYIQTVRTKGSELDTEKFYRYYTEATPSSANLKCQVIVQKYDDFCGTMPPLRAADLSPINRLPCNHIMRDMSMLVDGTVSMCREDINGTTALGNVFSEGLDDIWNRMGALYDKHCVADYPELCKKCDEYWTYNF